MPHIKSKILTIAAATGLVLAVNHADAQVRQPAPTGQVPKAYTGAQSSSAAFRPKPTGQIAPETPGRLGVIVQPAPAPTQRVSEVQDLGFEGKSRTDAQQGMVPKVNTTQDPLTMPERYQPQVSQQQSAAASGQVIIQTQQAPAAGTYAPATQTAPAPVTTGQTVPQQGQVNTPATASQPSGAPKTAAQRVDPK
ncbi:hypothetical protein GCM10007423_15460 [Dyadobacter endophyticus]|uniref:Uncharacterized protein n=1 Tax=Dyadobacter endophyticus TaxID=1749036 RepID=A0ABQ1YJL0_9BACT|nr:hypothetical protein [Dyadobacter endophyticus]GGH28690.1 hypothetical protein GCM10007423_15460 [Dyadobacter endophyticus]